MMIIRKGLFSLLVILGIGMLPVQAKSGAPEPTELYLVMSMAGVTAGSLRLTINAADDEVASSLKMKSQGLFKFMTGYKSRAEARSRPASNGIGPMPVSFDSRYETKNNERKVLIRYDPEDGRITDLETWKRGKPRKSKVPEELQLDTVDPLTAVLQLRHWIRAFSQDGMGTKGEASVDEVTPIPSFEIFDGRRRYRLNAEFMDRRQITFDGESRPAIRLKIRMQPLAGFSKKDMLANWAGEDGKRWIELIVTEDEDPIPISLKTRGGTLQTTVYLRKVCMGESGCRKVRG